MMGGARTALEVGRLLLSLDPLGDPMGCLLALDTHVLASRQGEFLVELYQSRLPVGYSPSVLARCSGDRAGEDTKWYMAHGFVRGRGTHRNQLRVYYSCYIIHVCRSDKKETLNLPINPHSRVTPLATIDNTETLT